MSAEATQDYYRKDQSTGITAPNLAKCCSYAEHVVSARGKRDQYTSVSLDPNRIHGFGDKLYRLLQEKLSKDGHDLVEHHILLTSLRQIAINGNKADRARALQALRYATKRKEGLISWKFDICSIELKDLISWAYSKVQSYFMRM